MDSAPERLLHAARVFALAVFFVGLHSSAHANEERELTLGLGPALFVEDTARSQEIIRLGEAERDPGDTSLDSRAVYNIQAWALLPLGIQDWKRRLRGGGGLAWYSRYTLTGEDSEDSFQAGNLLQLYAQAEYVAERIFRNVDAVFGLRGGPLLLFASGDLQRDLDDLSDRGFGVWPTPRLGVFVAPHAGARYPLGPRLRLRADLSLQLQRLWLVRATAEDGGITSEHRASLGTTRSQLLLGLELSL